MQREQPAVTAEGIAAEVNELQPAEVRQGGQGLQLVLLQVQALESEPQAPEGPRGNLQGGARPWCELPPSPSHPIGLEESLCLPSKRVERPRWRRQEARAGVGLRQSACRLLVTQMPGSESSLLGLNPLPLMTKPLSLPSKHKTVANAVDPCSFLLREPSVPALAGLSVDCTWSVTHP